MGTRKKKYQVFRLRGCRYLTDRVVAEEEKGQGLLKNPEPITGSG